MHFVTIALQSLPSLCRQQFDPFLGTDTLWTQKPSQLVFFTQVNVDRLVTHKHPELLVEQVAQERTVAAVEPHAVR